MEVMQAHLTHKSNAKQAAFCWTARHMILSSAWAKYLLGTCFARTINSQSCAFMLKLVLKFQKCERHSFKNNLSTQTSESQNRHLIQTQDGVNIIRYTSFRQQRL